MSYDSREPYSRRYDEEDERPTRSLDQGRYESGRHMREPARSEYGGYGSREFDREREYQGYGRSAYRSGYSSENLAFINPCGRR